jgi:hypothetical protein
MSSLRYNLNFPTVLNILSVDGVVRRKRECDVTEEHRTRQTSRAVKILKIWIESGVPIEKFKRLVEIDEDLVLNFKLCDEMTKEQRNTATAIALSISSLQSRDVEVRLKFLNTIYSAVF